MHRFVRHAVVLAFPCCLALGPRIARAADPRPTPSPAPAATVATDAARPWLLHLPGVAGECGIDHALLQGLRQGGYAGDARIYDWTDNNPGIPALLDRPHNDAEATKIAALIVEQARARPAAPIILTSHSGGTGLCVWALEKLPPGVQVDAVFLLSSALSPTYDLTAALAHVRGNVYAFSSPNDVIVLGAGTKVFGTIDGRRCEAAGKCGFTMPAGADAKQYEKLVARPYDAGWMKYGNIGDHIGVMEAAFSEAVIAPLVTGGRAATTAVPTTRPAAR